MKRVLWCGGSHMGVFRRLLNEEQELKDLLKGYESSFFATAGGETYPWIKAGGYLKLNENGHVSYRASRDLVDEDGNPLYCEPIDLNRFDKVVYLGNWFRPLQYLALSSWFENNNVISDSLLQSLSRNLVLNPPINGSGKDTISNETVFKVAKFFADKNKVFVVPDPYPREVLDKSIATRPSNYRTNLARYLNNNAFVETYYKCLEQVCIENDVTYIEQPKETVVEGCRITKHECGLYEDEFIHVNKLYYKEILMSPLLGFN